MLGVEGIQARLLINPKTVELIVWGYVRPSPSFSPTASKSNPGRGHNGIWIGEQDSPNLLKILVDGMGLSIEVCVEVAFVSSKEGEEEEEGQFTSSSCLKGP